MALWTILMEKILLEPLPEIVFGSSQPAISRAIRTAIKEGKIRKLSGRIYTSNLKDSFESIVARNRYLILGQLFPNAVLSHRTALEGGPTLENTIFLTYRYTKKFQLPGLIVRLIKGPGPLEGDTPFISRLYLASRARAYLENMQASRSRDGDAKTLTQKQIEERLDSLCQIHGVDELNLLRDQARILAPQLNLKNEFKVLDRLISAILGTHNVKILKSDRARARAIGEAYDQSRIELFARLIAVLKTQPFIKRNNNATTPEALQNLAFFEAYFSNYIEGTEFLIEEAMDIVFKHKIIAGRFEDTHDVLGTFQIVSNNNEMKQVPNSFERLIHLLKTRHAIMLGSRPQAGPGRFKEKSNRAGHTIFVAPELVIGTLKKGFELYKTLEAGIERAIFMMFMIAEIHPFADGNGRLARIMMNAELVATEQVRIIIPTVYREDYLLTLRALSRSQNAAPYTKMLDRAQRFTSSIDFTTIDRAISMLNKANAFLEPHEGKLKF